MGLDVPCSMVYGLEMTMEKPTFHLCWDDTFNLRQPFLLYIYIYISLYVYICEHPSDVRAEEKKNIKLVCNLL